MKKEWVRSIARYAAIGLMSFILASGVLANPVLDNVAAGQVSIQQAPNSTVVNQASQKAIINWKSFNIGASESTHFQQPHGGVALNRISPTDGASQIYGRLTATGQIILVNPAGVYFGSSAYVNVGGLIATTANIQDQDFLNGIYKFTKDGSYSGAIVNEGTIIAAQNGLIALVAPSVVNNGMIQANVGKVVLASGEAFTMNFSGDNLINFTVDQATSQRGHDKNGNALNDGVKNTGTLMADGGQILVTAKAASGVLDHVINMEGVVQARSVQQQNGEIIFSSDPNQGVIRVASKIDASGKGAGEKGGNVAVTGYNILLDSPTSIDVSGTAGGGNIRIGGNYQGKGPLPNANAVVMAGASLNANALSSGNGGEIILWSDNFTHADGNISSRGGSLSGNGGFIETSSHNVLDIGDLLVDARAPHGNMGTWLLDPRNVTINAVSTTGGSFSGANPNVFTPIADDATVLNTTINTNLATANVTINTGSTGAQAGIITVAAPITWTSTNTLLLDAANNIVINAAISGVNGSLNLQAGALANTITTGAGGTINVANFNLLRGTWSQVTASLPAFNVTNNFQIDSGALLSTNARFLRATGGTGASGTPYVITDIYGFQGIGSTSTSLGNSYNLGANINGAVTANWNSGQGLVPIGFDFFTNYSGTFNGLNNTISNVTVNRPSSTNTVGVFGYISGIVQNLGLTNVTVSGGGTASTGGFVGYLGNSATISNSYVTGTVTAGASNGPGLGGLVGQFGGGSISNSYSLATVNVVSTNSVGGLVGLMNNGTISGSYFNGIINVPAGNAGSTGGLVGIKQAGTVQTSYNAGSLIGGAGAGALGGLIGANTGGTVTNSYNIGSVTTSGGSTVGGLVASNTGGTVSNSYSSGVVSNPGGTFTGGFAGINNGGGSLTNNLWDTDASGQANGYGANSATVTSLRGGCFSGTCTIQPGANSTNPGAAVNLSALATYTGVGWSMTATPSTTSTAPANTWFIFAGGTRPLLMAEYSTSITNAHKLQLMGSTLGASYTLTGNLDLSTAMHNVSDVWGTNQGVSGAGFVPVGTNANNYSGTFAGQNFIISNLYINLPASSNSVGLFGAVGPTGSIQNLDVTSATVNGGTGNTGIVVGTANANGTNAATLSNLGSTGTVIGVSGNIGGLVGQLGSPAVQVPSLTNSYSTASVTGTGAAFSVGGLVGLVTNGTISNSYATGAVVAGDSVSGAGGLAGFMIGGSTISNSYSTGNVTVGNSSTAGGLVGWASPSITNSYSTGNVTGGTSSILGGLLGNSNGAIVTTSYSIGAVAGGAGSTVGGLIGTSVGTTTNSFWNTETSGQPIVSAGGTGLITAQMMQQANFTGFDFGSIWNIIPGQSFPYLRTFYTSTPRAISSTSPAAANTSVNLAVNGAVIDTVSTGANGFLYFLEGNNNISGINNSITDGTGLLIYLNSGSVFSNIVAAAPTSGGSLSGLAMAANTLTLSGSGTLSNTLLGTAKGALNSTNILYSVSGADLTLGNASHLVTNLTTDATINYLMDGTIGTTSGGSGNYTFNGTVDVDTIDVDGHLVTSNGSQTYNNTVNLATDARFDSGSGNITFNGIVSGLGHSISLQNGVGTTGSVVFNNDVSASSFGTLNDAISISLFGSNNSFDDGAGLVINHGIITLGNDATDQFNILSAVGGGLNSTISSLTLNGVFNTTSGPIAIASAVLAGDTQLNSATSISLGNVSGAHALVLSSPNGTTFNNTINIGSLSSSGGGTDVINTTAITTTGNQLYDNAVSLTSSPTLNSGSGSITFNSTVSGAQTLALQDATIGSTGEVTFNGNVAIAGLTTFGGASNYGVIFNGSTNTFTNAVTFNNLNGVTLGNGGDSFTFNGGLTSTASTTTISGAIATSNDAISLGAVTLGSDSSLLSGSAAIGVSGAVSGASNILSLQDAGATGTATFSNDVTLAGLTTFGGAYGVVFNGASNIFTNAVTFNNTNGVTLGNGSDSFTFNGGLTSTASTTTLGGVIATSNDAISLGAVTLGADSSLLSGSAAIDVSGAVNGASNTLAVQNGSATGTATFSNNVTLGGLTTFASAYGVVLNGASNTFTNAVTFNNTNGVTLGNGGDNFTFTGGLTSTASTTTLGGTINSSNAVSLGTIVLGANSAISNSSGGAIALGAISGANSLNLTTNAAGASLNGIVNIASLTTGGTGTTTINTSTVTTSGNQAYNNAVNVATDTALTGASVSIASGVTGGNDLAVNANTSSISGTLALDNLIITGTGGSNNFTLNTGSAQTWNISGSDLGSLAGLAGISGTASFSNIQNMTGGSSADNFNLTGGSVSGTINGGAGNNTITANNTSNTWNVTGSNAGDVTSVANFSNVQNLAGGTSDDEFHMMGGSVSSISGGAGNNTLVAQNGVSNTWNINGTNSGSATNVSNFSDIQNAMGGDTGNNFIFANNAAMTGLVNGGSLSSTNTLNYNAYTTDVNVTLSATNDGITDNSGSNITNFININNLVGNANNNNFITLPNKTNTLTLTGAREGYINDPIFFSGFQSFIGQSGLDEVLFTVPAQINGNTVTINGVTMFFTNFAFSNPPVPPTPPGPPSTTPIDVSQIIQQQPASGSGGGSGGVVLDPGVTQNINDMLKEINQEYDDRLAQVKINPYCYTANQ